ncbi:hypothetical protein CAEBREN_01884 [Caenorhabditis brenneri]|uniref:Uncharacterized protein n=1 Tax=Caenorhabditis brenneri TaxID=135651 RepID=G0NXL8_CAEBE|nr:hypothetical protein CAEBREN_01884 [Caenorhabditis brenneri]
MYVFYHTKIWTTALSLPMIITFFSCPHELERHAIAITSLRARSLTNPSSETMRHHTRLRRNMWSCYNELMKVVGKTDVNVEAATASPTGVSEKCTPRKSTQPTGNALYREYRQRVVSLSTARAFLSLFSQSFRYHEHFLLSSIVPRRRLKDNVAKKDAWKMQLSILELITKRETNWRLRCNKIRDEG